MIQKNSPKKNTLLFSLLLFSLILYMDFAFAKKSATPPLTAYMDQVIHRKKKLIVKKCLKSNAKYSSGFMIVEMAVGDSGKARARVLSTDIQNKGILNCSLSVLNKIKLKNTTQAFTRIYRFFLL